MKKLSLLALHQAKKSINKQLATYAAGQFKTRRLKC
jgi:hypothetical protein